MARHSQFGLLLIFACLQACSIFQDGGRDLDVELNEEFELRIGETAVFKQVNHLFEKDTEITFEEFNGDSRCPINFVCIWSGLVDLTFSAITDGNSEILDYEGFLGLEDDFYLGHSFGSVYELQLVRVDPYPIHLNGSGPVERRPEDIVTTLRVVQIGIIE